MKKILFVSFILAILSSSLNAQQLFPKGIKTDSISTFSLEKLVIKSRTTFQKALYLDSIFGGRASGIINKGAFLSDTTKFVLVSDTSGRWQAKGSYLNLADTTKVLAGTNVTVTYAGHSATVSASGGGGSVGNADSLGAVPASGYVRTTRSLTINGSAQDLSANRTWSVGTIVASDTSLLSTRINSKLDSTLTSGNIFVGNANNSAKGVAVSGDASMSNAGVLGVNKTRLNVRNETGTTIASTRAVYISGFNNLPLIGLVSNLVEAQHNFIGITIAPITSPANGFIATSGQLDAETNGWVVGTELYLSTSGNLTSVEPTSGTVRHAGIVTVQANYPTGKILMYTQPEEYYASMTTGMDYNIRMGDSLGVNKILFKNYNNTIVASMNSLGMMFYGTDTASTKAYARSIVASFISWDSTYAYKKAYTDALLSAKQNTISNIADTSKYLKKSDSTNIVTGFTTRDMFRRDSIAVTLKQNTIANLSDTSKYLKKSDSTNIVTGFTTRDMFRRDSIAVTLKQGTIANLSDTSKYLKKSDSTNIVTGFTTRDMFRRDSVALTLKATTSTLKQGAYLSDTTKFSLLADSSIAGYGILFGQKSHQDTIKIDTSKYATGTQSGFLRQTDWATFNAKGSGAGSVTSITQGTGMNFNTSPITTTGTINVDTTFVVTRYDTLAMFDNRVKRDTISLSNRIDGKQATGDYATKANVHDSIWAYTNQGVKTSSSPTFANITASGTTDPSLFLANTTATTGRTWKLYSIPDGRLVIQDLGVKNAVIFTPTTGLATFGGNIAFENPAFISNANGYLVLSSNTNTYLRATTEVRISDDAATPTNIGAGGGLTTIGTGGLTLNGALSMGTNAISSVGAITSSGQWTMNNATPDITAQISGVEYWQTVMGSSFWGIYNTGGGSGGTGTYSFQIAKTTGNATFAGSGTFGGSLTRNVSVNGTSGSPSTETLLAYGAYGAGIFGTNRYATDYGTGLIFKTITAGNTVNNTLILGLDNSATFAGSGTFGGAVRTTGTHYIGASGGSALEFTDADIAWKGGKISMSESGDDASLLIETRHGSLGTHITLNGADKSTTFAGSGTFGGSVFVAPNSTATTLGLGRANTAQNAIIKFSTGTIDTDDRWILGMRNTSDETFRLYNYALGADALIIANTTGNATFAGTIASSGLTADSSITGVGGHFTRGLLVGGNASVAGTVKGSNVVYNIYRSSKEQATTGDVPAMTEFVETSTTTKVKIRTTFVYKTGNKVLRLTASLKHDGDDDANTVTAALSSNSIASSGLSKTKSSYQTASVTVDLTGGTFTNGIPYEVDVNLYLSSKTNATTAYMTNVVVDVESTQ